MTIDELNCKASEIYSEITKIETRFYAEKKPLTDKIDALNNQYLDDLLKDSNGETIKVGMVIADQQNKQYCVTRRYQQHLFRFLGNAQVEIIPVGKKKKASLGYRILVNYTIVK